MRRRRRPRRGGLGTFLVVVGGLTVVGLAVALGLVAGRAWLVPELPASTTEPSPVGLAARGGEGRGTVPGVPALTFYRDLTAPLGAELERAMEPRGASSWIAGASEVPRSARAMTRPRALQPRAPDRPEPGAAALPPRRRDLGPPSPAVDAADREARGFTVQVAAYRGPATAEALRARLSAAGYDAYVVSTATGDGVHYRVRVGAFATRAEAMAVAERLTAERGAPTYVTAR